MKKVRFPRKQKKLYKKFNRNGFMNIKMLNTEILKNQFYNEMSKNTIRAKGSILPEPSKESQAYCFRINFNPTLIKNLTIDEQH